MAYLVRPDGSIETDTADEALALYESRLRALWPTGTPKKGKAPRPPVVRTWNWPALYVKLQEPSYRNQLRVLTMIKRAGREGAGLYNMVRRLGVPEYDACVGLPIHEISNLARELGIPLHQILWREYRKGGVGSCYHAGPLLRKNRLPEL